MTNAPTAAETRPSSAELHGLDGQLLFTNPTVPTTILFLAVAHVALRAQSAVV